MVGLQTWLIDHGREVIQYDPASREVIVHFSCDKKDPYRPIFQMLYPNNVIEQGDDWKFSATELKKVYHALDAHLLISNIDRERVAILKRVFYHAICFSVTITVSALSVKAIPLDRSRVEIGRHTKKFFCTETEAQAKADALVNFLDSISFEQDNAGNQQLPVKEILDKLCQLQDNPNIQKRRSIPSFLDSYCPLPKTWLNHTCWLIDVLFQDLRDYMLKQADELLEVYSPVHWQKNPIKIYSAQQKLLQGTSGSPRSQEIEMKVFGQ